MVKIYNLKFIVLVSIFSFLTACSSGGGGASGGISTSSGVGSSDSSNDNAILGLAAAVLAGTVLYRTVISSMSRTSPEDKPILKKQLPTFVVEGRGERKWDKSDSSYVIFSTKSDALNKKRHVAFCKSLRDKFYPELTKSTNRNNSTIKTFPTIWPSINSFFNEKNSCDELVKIYDDNFAREVLLQGNYPTDRGPFLVAFSNDFSRKEKRPYWNLSDYEVVDFERQIDRWYDITSSHPTQMEQTLLRIESEETTRKVLMGLGRKRNSNLAEFRLTVK